MNTGYQRWNTGCIKKKKWIVFHFDYKFFVVNLDSTCKKLQKL